MRSGLRLIALAALVVALGAWTTSAARCRAGGNGQGNDSSVALGNGSGNSSTGDGQGDGQGDNQLIGRGNGRCGRSGAGVGPRGAGNPRLTVTIRYDAPRLTIRVHLAADARGTTRIAVSGPGHEPPVRGHFPHYTAAVTRAGTWTVVVTFTAHRGWGDRRTRITIIVP